MRQQAPWDALIVGGGPAGLAAGIYLARAGWKTALLEKAALGGQARFIPRIENYPGFPRGVSGKELMRRFAAQARRWKLKSLKEEATRVSREGDGFRILAGRAAHEARSVILCGGTRFRGLGLPEEEALAGRGIHHDAFELAERYAGLRVAVVGGGDAAVHQALWLSRKARRVTLIHRGAALTALPLLRRRLAARRNVALLFQTVVKSARASGAALGAVELEDLRTGRRRRLAVEGLFILVGKEADALPTSWRRAPAGFFTAGDAAQGRFRQVAIAAGDGLRAAMSCESHLMGR